jgi:excisionase family DNA binding protein
MQYRTSPFGPEALQGRLTLTVEETASLLGLGRSAAYEAIRRGDLPARRIGRRLYVPVPALLVWLGVPLVDEEG